MIRVLHIFNVMGNGGIEHYVMDRYRRIDRSKIQFDFLITSNVPGYFDEEIKKLGGKIYFTEPITKNPIKTVLQIKNIVKKNNYQVVHRHTGNAIAYLDLRAAKFGGAKNLIIHSHNNSAERLGIHKFAKKYLKMNCIRLACSDSAGRWLFDDKPYKVMKNAIDISKYEFNPEKREEYRKKYGLENCFVLGHVGRIEYQKNHDFLIDIFAELKKQKENAKLVCIGDGHLLDEVKEKIAKYGLTDSVIFTGSIDNVSEVVNVFDVFCLPSRYEGFPITLVEAQVNGLSCIASDCVTKESNITGKVRYLSLSEDLPCKWAEAILQSANGRKEDAPQIISDAGYDIDKEVKELETFYQGLAK